MVYAKRMFKRYRKNLRNNRALSTRRIFNNKSAKNQAKQIYALRRSINYVKSQCAPEVKYNDSTKEVKSFTPTYAEPGDPYSNNNLLMITGLPGIVVGTSDNTRIGDKVKLLPIKWYLSGIFRHITNSSSGIPFYNLNNSTACGLRIVALQTKSSTNSLPAIRDIFPDFEETLSPALTPINMTIPFKRGITTKYHILLNKRVYFNDVRSQRSFALNITPKIKDLRWEQNQLYPAGYIIFIIIATGLQLNGSDLANGDYSMLELNHWSRVAYTDA